MQGYSKGRWGAAFCALLAVLAIGASVASAGGPSLTVVGEVFSATAGTPRSGQIATFTYQLGCTGDDTADYTATVDWGDGSPVEPAAIATFEDTFCTGTVTGTHTYASPGSYPTTITVNRPESGRTGVGNGQANVTADCGPYDLAGDCVVSAACDPLPANAIVGTPGDDVITGTPGDDVIEAFGGDDVIYGLGGNDLICSGNGNDRSFGGDTISNSPDGNDRIFGGLGNDRLYGKVGNDNLYGEQGDDQLYGDQGDDQLYGDRGNDYGNGGLGNDLMNGGLHDDDLEGSNGDDFIQGSNGDDDLNGGFGFDTAEGGFGLDSFNQFEVFIGNGSNGGTG
jgi:Ca2+-binding RTX toxin-like protein